MNSNPYFPEYKKLADAARKGQAVNEARLAEVTALHSQWQVANTPRVPVRTIMDLPVAKNCWKADAKHIER